MQILLRGSPTRSALRKYGVIVALVLLASSGLTAQAAPSAVARLENINRQVADAKKKEADLEASAKMLQQQIKDHQASIAKLKDGQAKLADQIKRRDNDRQVLDKRISFLESRINILEQVTRNRVKALYLTQRDELLEEIFLVPGGSDIGRSAFLIGKVRAFDDSILREMKHSREEVALMDEQLTTIDQQQASLKDDFDDRSVELATKIADERKASKDMDSTRAQIKSTLENLRQQAGILEKVVALITSGEQPDSIEEAPQKTERSSTAYEGIGLGQGLGVPVSAPVLQGFGKHKLSEFEDFVFEKGIEFAAIPGTPINAIAPGIVRFSGQMPGYGTILMIDHGKRYYSLYGRLGKIEVDSGKEVAQGERIGEASSPDTRGRSFYFEIRKNGKPENPILYYGKVLGAATK